MAKTTAEILLTPARGACDGTNHTIKVRDDQHVTLDVRRVTLDGAQQRIPSLPSVRMIDSDGNVVFVQVHTTRNTKQAPIGHYRSEIEAKRQRKGWILYDQPPYGMTVEQWAVEREKVIKERQIAHEKADFHFQAEAKRRLEEEVKRIGQGVANGMRDGMLEAMKVLQANQANQANQGQRGRGKPGAEE